MIKPIYLDYNGTTPHDPEVIAAMRPFLETEFGNPSSSHWYGIRPKKAVEKGLQVPIFVKTSLAPGSKVVIDYLKDQESEPDPGLLDKLGIVPHVSKIKDYKSAAEMIMNEEMSDAAREMMNWMVGDFTDVLGSRPLGRALRAAKI